MGNIGNPINSDFRYVQTDMYIFSNGYIGNGHIGNDYIKCIGIQICPFPICPFSDKPPFLPAPYKTLEEEHILTWGPVLKPV
jgi:hypothetical protein